MSGLLLDMLSKLTGAYNKNPDSLIGKLFSLFADSLWGIEDTLQLVALWRDVNQAKGTTLDRIGRNFGVQRDNASDAFYRLMIKVKVTGLLSGGDVDTIITATSVLFDIEPEQVEAVELFPAKMRVILDEDDIDPEYREHEDSSARIIKRLMAAGVGKEVVFRRRIKTEATLYIGATVYEKVRLSIKGMSGIRELSVPLYAGAAIVTHTRIPIAPME